MQPTQRRHSRSEVVDAAVRLLDDYGLADLTMRRLARELGVSPGALYWHFANKQDLLGAVSDRVLAPTTQAVPATGWRERMLGTGTALRDALLSTTDGAELVSASFAAGTSTRLAAVLDVLTSCAVDAGMDEGHAELVGRTLVHYVLGFTSDEQSRIQWDAAGALAEGQSILGVDATARFTFGLGLLVTGVAHAPSPSLAESADS